MSDDFSTNGQKRTPGMFERDIANAFQKLDKQYDQQRFYPFRYATGFKSLDQIIGGFYPEELIILTGDIGIGKTAFACSLACNKRIIGVSDQDLILYFSHKDSRLALATKVLGAFSKVPLPDIISGAFKGSCWPQLTRAVGTLENLNLTIVDSPGNICEIEATVIEAMQKKEVRLVIIDDLQFIESVQEAVAESRERELANIAIRLKKMAQHAQIPIIIVVPSNRKHSSSESLLFESAADKILCIHRSEFYAKENPAQEIAEIIVTKNNMGWTGTAELAFRGPCLGYEDLGSIASAALERFHQIISRELHGSEDSTNAPDAE